MHCCWFLSFNLWFPPTTTFSFSVIYLLKKLLFSCRVSHSLDFADCYHVTLFNIFLHSCIFCKLGVKSGGLIGLKLI